MQIVSNKYNTVFRTFVLHMAHQISFPGTMFLWAPPGVIIKHQEYPRNKPWALLDKVSFAKSPQFTDSWIHPD